MTVALRAFYKRNDKKRRTKKTATLLKYIRNNLAAYEAVSTDCYVSHAIEISWRVAISGNGAAVNNNTDTPAISR